MNPKFGLIYVATGRSYFDEAISNIARSSAFISHLPITIYSDCVYQHNLLPKNVSVKILSNPLFSYGDKITPLSEAPYDYNLFLDTDTVVISTVDYLFDLLSTFDLCASLAPVRHPCGWSSSNPPTLFTEFNTGVILYRRSSTTQQFFYDWQQLYNNLFLEFNQTWDQASFREILWLYISTSKFRFFTLPPECNLRLTKPWIVGKGLKASILHGRLDNTDLNNLISYLNSDVSFFRTWEDWQKLYPDSKLKLRTIPNPSIPSS